ncbi:hypothetical protein [Paenibacillus glycinis]|uniref:Copper amine oxidase-like N-terminal domain-containing protein n=1 Tax=Paenibacillus glycinis TaxID=2697035 RepID=A0ABW9XPN8_9BACL|nr:hypothetical protein [Paenibacillus glycinis]NBD24598.1 hypothetical protein [Paenibacillus glycinis]
MKKRNKWLTAVALTVLFGTSAAAQTLGTANAASTAVGIAGAAVPVGEMSLYPNGRMYDLRKPGDQLLVKNSITYMSLKELAVVYSDYVWSIDGQGVLNVTGPNHKLSWGKTSRYAYTNSGTRMMASAPIKHNGEWFYPLKSISAWAGGTIRLYPSKELGVDYAPLSMVTGDSSGWYWVRRDNGIAYEAIGSELPHTIGWTNVRAYQYYGISETKLDAKGSVLLKIMHSHGEPSLAADYYSLVIQNGKLVRQTEELYYGFGNTQSIQKSTDGYHVLLNKTGALFLDHAGNTVLGYDMGSLLGSDKNFTIEYASVDEGIALVRPYAAATLLLVDMNKDTAVPLYKELLSAEEQQLLDTWPNNQFDYPTDKLKLIKREGNVFTFEHRALMGTGVETLSYTWKRS